MTTRPIFILLALTSLIVVVRAQDSKPAMPTSAPADALPTVSDLRPWFTAEGIGPRGQGPRPTCSVFATTSAIEAAVARHEGRGTRLSVEYLNWAGNAATARDDDGDFFHNILAGFTTFGAVDESSWPYAAAFDAKNAADEAKIAVGKKNLARWKDDIRLHWVRKIGGPGLDAEQFADFRRLLADGRPVAIGAGHSRLAVGYIEDPKSPGGGRVLTIDSGWGVFAEVTAEFVKTGVYDAFAFDIDHADVPGEHVDLRPRLGGMGWVPPTATESGEGPMRVALFRAAQALRTAKGLSDVVLGTDERSAVGTDAEKCANDVQREIDADRPVLVRMNDGSLAIIVGYRKNLTNDRTFDWMLADPTKAYVTQSSAGVFGALQRITCVTIATSATPKSAEK